MELSSTLNIAVLTIYGIKYYNTFNLVSFTPKKYIKNLVTDNVSHENKNEQRKK